MALPTGEPSTFKSLADSIARRGGWTSKPDRLYRGGPARLSKKWLCRFFEKASLRSAPRLSADSGQFDAHSAQSVFRHAHVAAENISYCFRVCGRETLRGFLSCCQKPAGLLVQQDTLQDIQALAGCLVVLSNLNENHNFSCICICGIPSSRNSSEVWRKPHLSYSARA